MKLKLIFFLLFLFLVSCSKNGIKKQYYDNGKLKFLIPYKNGKINGVILGYYSSGELKGEYYYNDGLRNGKYLDFYKNGKIKYEQNFINNVKQGSAFEFDSLGNIIDSQFYKNNLKEGIFRKFYPNGNVSVQAFFKNNKKNGETIRYYENGKVFSVEEFKNDDLISKKEYTVLGNDIYPTIPMKITSKNGNKCKLNSLCSIALEILEKRHKDSQLGIVIGDIDSNNEIIDTVFKKLTKDRIVNYDFKIDKQGEYVINGFAFEVLVDTVFNANYIISKSKIHYKINYE